MSCGTCAGPFSTRLPIDNYWKKCNDTNNTWKPFVPLWDPISDSKAPCSNAGIFSARMTTNFINTNMNNTWNDRNEPWEPPSMMTTMPIGRKKKSRVAKNRARNRRRMMRRTMMMMMNRPIIPSWKFAAWKFLSVYPNTMTIPVGATMSRILATMNHGRGHSKCRIRPRPRKRNPSRIFCPARKDCPVLVSETMMTTRMMINRTKRNQHSPPSA